jgi:uncharacterized membrane protein YfcA
MLELRLMTMPPTETPNPATIEEPPTRARAIVCLLLNIIVFPGLGTLTSGDRTRKRTGVIQLGLGIFLIPMLVLTVLGTAIFHGVDQSTMMAWIGNFILLLVLWTVVTSVQIFREAWRKTKAGQ